MSFVVHLRRAKDLVDLELEFVNLTLDVSNPAFPHLHRTSAGPAHIVMRLPSQHVAEAAFARTSPRSLPYTGFLACPSKMSFAVPESIADIPFSVEGLLR